MKEKKRERVRERENEQKEYYAVKLIRQQKKELFDLKNFSKKNLKKN